jgi:sugar O-acyltransferase (sialic acid O-acetyltransferase NeuD family)
MECRELVILGAGGLGREVLFQLLDSNSINNCYNILGFVDSDVNLHGKIINGFPVLGDDAWLLNYSDRINVVVCIGNPRVRKQVVTNISINKKIIFPSVIASDVKYSDTTVIGKGSIICMSSILTVNNSIGDFVVINMNCTIGHDVSLKDFVTLYPSVNVCGYVNIGAYTEVGVGSSIIQNITIGENVIIGACSGVMWDIPLNRTVVGVPARQISKVEG